MKLQLWSLLSLVLAACLQTVDPSSQDASGDKGSYNLVIAKQEVIDQSNVSYHAGITKLELAARQEFGESVELKANMPLHDNSPLVFKNIAFDFIANETTYDCTLEDEKQLMRQIPFTASKCKQKEVSTSQPTTYQYGKYVLENKNQDEEKRIAVKIEIGGNGIPSKMDVKDLKDTTASTQTIELEPKGELLNSPNQIWQGYGGSKEKEEFLVKYNKDASDIAKMIANKELPKLVYTNDGEKYTSNKSSSVITEDEYKSLTAQ